jgi:hypothetical protein
MIKGISIKPQSEHNSGKPPDILSSYYLKNIHTLLCLSHKISKFWIHTFCKLKPILVPSKSTSHNIWLVTLSSKNTFIITILVNFLPKFFLTSQTRIIYEMPTTFKIEGHTSLDACAHSHSTKMKANYIWNPYLKLHHCHQAMPLPKRSSAIPLKHYVSSQSIPLTVFVSECYV